ncbi:MAG: hypothetical protein S4CHLAM2_06510 [Chlamydiales bacterium]|nr:hypothetical protein [Chlamydiales bacterium]
MPLFGRYLLLHYLKVLLLSVLSFIAILLVSRLEDIAHFASLGAPTAYLTRFVLYQIPYILPIAIPISCLISSMILFQRLSQTHELTALRAGGFSLKQILAPILIAGAFLSLGNFYITSELATTSHLATRRMAHSLISVNPLILLQSAKAAQLKRSYVQMDPIQNGKAAQNVLVVLKNTPKGRLHLGLAKKITTETGTLCAEQVSLVSSLPSAEAPHLVIENQEQLTASAAEFASMMYGKGWKIATDHLKLSLLRARTLLYQEQSGAEAAHHLARCHSEYVKRISLGLAAFTFTLMGVSFGMQISRNRAKKGFFLALFLTALTFITFFLGKELSTWVWVASTLFLLPHVLITITSIWSLTRVSRGIE